MATILQFRLAMTVGVDCWRSKFLGALIAAAFGGALHAETISGSARAIDGDTFELGDVVIRLADVDTPEVAQACSNGPKLLRHCGAFVADAMAERLRGRTIQCEVQGIDDYDRRIARCQLDGEDLSTWLVSEGLGLAFRKYSTKLVAVEEQAHAAKRGLWQTIFEAPWEFRAHRWEVAKQEAPQGCPIKGNLVISITHPAMMIRYGWGAVRAQA